MPLILFYFAIVYAADFSPALLMPLISIIAIFAVADAAATTPLPLSIFFAISFHCHLRHADAFI
jgi:hypothetical protein